MMNSSTTKSTDAPSKSDLGLIIFHLTNDCVIMGHIIDQTNNLISLHFPMELSAIFDDENNFEGFSIMPYLMPFVELDIQTVVNFNMNQITSFAKPSTEIRNQYLKIIKKQSGELAEKEEPDPFDLTTMETPTVWH